MAPITSGPTHATVTLDSEEVHGLSVSILQSLESHEVEVSVAVAALALSFGRLMSPVIMEEDTEWEFLQAVLEWTALYHTSGSVH